MKNSPLKGPFQKASYTNNAHRDYISWTNTKNLSNTKNRDNVVTSPDYKCQGRIAIYRAGLQYVSWAAVSILYRYIAISSHPYYELLHRFRAGTEKGLFLFFLLEIVNTFMVTRTFLNNIQSFSLYLWGHMILLDSRHFTKHRALVFLSRHSVETHTRTLLPW